MIDANELRQQAKGRWRGVFDALGIDVGTGKHKCCPICSPNDPDSDRFRFDDKNGDGTWFCNQCSPKSGDGISLVQKYCGTSFPETLRKIAYIIGHVDLNKTPVKKELSIKKKKEILNKMWKESKKISGGDMVSRYLHGRKLILEPNYIRFCEKCYERSTKQKLPAMVAMMVNSDGKPATIHRTYLSDKGKSDVEKPKMLMPAVMDLPGCAVRLFPAENGAIGIAEGIETAIAATQLFSIPTWSAVSSSIMEGFKPPDGIRQVYIFGDNDANFAGQLSAYKLANNLVKKDFIVHVEIPDAIGDWADVVVGRKDNQIQQPNF